MAEDAPAPDHPGAVWHPSPNFGPRRHGGDPNLIVIHYTAMKSARAALDRLCDPAPADGGAVSAHYLVCERGEVWQMVAERDRAWHAGAGNWAGCEDVNSHSVGIELANDGDSPFAAPLMDTLEGLLTGIMTRWRIGPAGVIGHSDMAPGRKIDPGPRFDWRRLARQGLAVWPEQGAAGDFDADLAAIGYRAPEGADDALMLDTFRMRFRPWGRGPLTEADRCAARAVAAACRAG
ncbi:N-acetylmuramoyl-L-alanine amidase [Oceanicola sp. 22II-s10i]|uniref:N-acetylmuramoyl-L-alanine amidase n=1 Tax=Oceanicola sp. 22II-s10i TaxID=1317116 RepID=UPI000B527028|nr:N-acetylmuramoyl-L-alanine amidase [Oceanicola sp. 22II-s10i]OWU86621.1 N-acetylmuramoyl-L-alanine amidase [Oceanicola sp. 22II-s10i]